jgi:hypothetical protein
MTDLDVYLRIKRQGRSTRKYVCLLVGRLYH